MRGLAFLTAVGKREPNMYASVTPTKGGGKIQVSRVYASWVWGVNLIM